MAACQLASSSLRLSDASSAIEKLYFHWSWTKAWSLLCRIINNQHIVMSWWAHFLLTNNIGFNLKTTRFTDLVGLFFWRSALNFYIITVTWMIRFLSGLKRSRRVHGWTTSQLLTGLTPLYSLHAKTPRRACCWWAEPTKQERGLRNHVEKERTRSQVTFRIKSDLNPPGRSWNSWQICPPSRCKHNENNCIITSVCLGPVMVTNN